MARITITIEDDQSGNGKVAIRVDFDPPILGKENETATAAHRVGMRMIQTISKSEVVPPCNSK